MTREQIKIYSNVKLYFSGSISQNNYVYVSWLEPRMNFSSVRAHTVKTLMQMINGAPRTIQTGFW